MASIPSSMRTFRIRGPFGVQVTLETMVPGTLSITFPGSSSAAALRLPESVSTTPEKLNVRIPIEMPKRAPSPVPTDIITTEPTQAEITASLRSHGIKIRDFAHPPSSPSHTYATLSQSTPISPAPALTPVTEIFDPHTALAEHDIRLSQSPRDFPIRGKTLRRLLDIAWVTTSNQARWTPRDWAALRAYDDMCVARGQALELAETGSNPPEAGPSTSDPSAHAGVEATRERHRRRGEYPWRALPATLPFGAQRTAVVNTRRSLITTFDYCRKQEAAISREHARADAERREWEARAARADDSDPGDDPGSSTGSDSGGGPEIRDETPAEGSSGMKRPLADDSPAPDAKRLRGAAHQQMPAPIACYDPLIYPDAERVKAQADAISAELGLGAGAGVESAVRQLVDRAGAPSPDALRRSASPVSATRPSTLGLDVEHDSTPPVSAEAGPSTTGMRRLGRTQTLQSF